MAKKFCVIGRNAGPANISQHERRFYDNVDDAVAHAKALIKAKYDPNKPVELYVAEVVKVVGTAQPIIHVHDAESVEVGVDPLFT